MRAAREHLRTLEGHLAEAEAGAAVRAETLAADVARRERDLETMRQDLAAAQAEPVTEPDGAAARAELDEADAAVAKLRDEQLELQGRERAAGRGEALREQADKERGVLELRTKKAESLKALRDAQQKLRAHVIEQLVGPVEQTAQQVLREIDEAKTFRFVFEREGRDTFDFGFEEDGVFRSYDAASTGEDAFLSVVLVAALIAACAPPWRVLLVDNVEQIDDLRRRWLMMALGRISDRLDNIILAGCCDFAEIEGWTVVDVEQLTGRRAVVAA
jgi:exonuclease SbcC